MLKQKSKVAIVLASVVVVFLLPATILSSCFSNLVFASDTAFQIQVTEGLSVAISAPTTWAEGDSGTFIVNEFNLNIKSNNSAGFHARMTSGSATPSLVNASTANSDNPVTLPTLSAAWTRSSSTTNFWGYSTDDTTYNAIPGLNGTAIALLDSNTAGSGSEDIYFGAKADDSQAAGSYTGKIVISVVTGTISNDNPAIPSDPTEPIDENSTPFYDSDKDETVFTTRTTSGSGSSATDITTTEITSGDTKSLYEDPQGETVTTSGNSLTVALAAAAVVTAMSGITFFILAKRRDDDDEDEEDEYYE